MPHMGFLYLCCLKKEIENQVPISIDIYFKMLYNSDVNEIRMDVAENQSVVMLPTLEFCAFTLFGVT